jgi:STE24 endopeptidase
LIGFSTLVTTVGLFCAGVLFDRWIPSLGLAGVADPAGLPALALILGAYGLLTMPLENAFSRWREGLADNYALEATGQPEAFASALRRLANLNLGEVDPEKWVVWLFHSHPPLGERIAKAEGWRA